MADATQSAERVYKGVGVSAGICHGKLLVLTKPDVTVPQFDVPEDQVEQQIKRFEQALVLTRQHVLEVQRQVSQALNSKDASIFDAHLLVLEDPTLVESVNNLICQKKINAEAAFQEFADKYMATLAAIDDPYLRERAADMRDVTSRIMHNLLGVHQHDDIRSLREPCVLLSEDLSPSQVAMLNPKITIGFATDVGSKTSHMAIMARSLRIPAVVGLRNASRKIKTGADVLLDGYNGLVIVNPTDQTLFEYGRKAQRQVSIEEKLREVQNLPA